MYVPDAEPDSVFVVTAWELTGRPPAAHPSRGKKAPMNQSQFPKGWGEERVRRILAHYEEQTEDETVAEDEEAIESPDTVMSVPHDPKCVS